ncbi:MAG: BON domain-containing protein [Lysobacterales bacterium]|nr:MAG: BON domain-containing protein [Xanthomonadales bacterium]
MYTKLPKLALASAIALALASFSGAAFAGAPSQEVVEARQEAQILTTYALSPYLRAGDLNVSVEDGTATLTGIVAEDVNSALAKQIALGVTGIEKVDNQIEVKADYAPPAANSGERSFGEVVDDATITTTVKSKLLWSKSTEGMQMDVDTNLGKVTLNGAAENGAAKELAGRIALNTRGVESVDNRLVVDASTPKPAPERADADSGNDTDTTSQAVADSWITTKVKSTFMYSSNVESNDISASTDSGVVTLSGTVDSGAERELAIELAQNVRGVRSVDATALTF